MTRTEGIAMAGIISTMTIPVGIIFGFLLAGFLGVLVAIITGIVGATFTIKALS